MAENDFCEQMVSASDNCISYQEALTHLSSYQLQPAIASSTKQSFNSSPDCDWLFALAKVGYYDHDSQFHEKMLQSVFCTLTSLPDCPSKGPHWTKIGFQQDDPSFDLRGVGLLGVLQMLFLTTQHATLAREIYTMSASEKNGFPFALISLNISSVILSLLRQSRKARNSVSVLENVNQFYVSLFGCFINIWKEKSCTIIDSDSVLKTIFALAKDNQEILYKN